MLNFIKKKEIEKRRKKELLLHENKTGFYYSY
jgi:hypothetical protein